MDINDVALAKINTYREHNKRCRTCMFAKQDNYNDWFCSAKQQRHNGRLAEQNYKGIFCGLYEARKFGEMNER